MVLLLLPQDGGQRMSGPLTSNSTQSDSEALSSITRPLGAVEPQSRPVPLSPSHSPPWGTSQQSVMPCSPVPSSSPPQAGALL